MMGVCESDIVAAAPDFVLAAADTASGEHVLGGYVEREWLPVIGPSAWAMIRNLTLRHIAGDTTVHLGDLAATIGLSDKIGANTPAVRTLGRLIRFRLVALNGWTLTVNTSVGQAPLPHRKMVTA